MAWKKSSPDAVQRFDTLAAVKGAKRGLLFGCPSYVLKGERYATLYQDKVVLRLSPTDAVDLISRGGRALAKSRKTSANRVLVDLIAVGLQSREAEKDRFFSLVNRLTELATRLSGNT
jgi:hypothetical protein